LLLACRKRERRQSCPRKKCRAEQEGREVLSVDHDTPTGSDREKSWWGSSTYLGIARRELDKLISTLKFSAREDPWKSRSVDRDPCWEGCVMSRVHRPSVRPPPAFRPVLEEGQHSQPIFSLRRREALSLCSPSHHQTSVAPDRSPPRPPEQ
jgi:hypothetical protein